MRSDFGCRLFLFFVMLWVSINDYDLLETVQDL